VESGISLGEMDKVVFRVLMIKVIIDRKGNLGSSVLIQLWANKVPEKKK
jgi:hypothetical protein